MDEIAGVILAGGKSSRMGRDKSQLLFNGVTFIDHIHALLSNSGITNIFISGDIEGYNNCIPDITPHKGPAIAIANILTALKRFKGVLFVPVDMPLLTAELLEQLMSYKKGAYYNVSPLPAFITSHSSLEYETLNSVRSLLEHLKVQQINLPKGQSIYMKNINTPFELREALKQ
jgi:molybdopterin-guanine dinucleotide biosynthesis protein A